ncbi:MAG: hypothetical protein V2A58_09630, partial [Planctomycetota bacterium]
VRKHLLHLEDSGMVHYRDDGLGIVLALRYGLLCTRSAYRRTRCPCDRLADAPGAGHFALFVDGVPLLVTPDGGYRLHSSLRSCMLVDGKGQYGDVGYPMSIPDARKALEEVECLQWDDGRAEGRVRLNLRPAYPEELDLSHYTREFVITGGRRLICRDEVAFDSPHALSWLFHGKRQNELALEQRLCARLGIKPALRIVPTVFEGTRLKATVHETEVVWSYASPSGFNPFDHVRYWMTGPVRVAVVQFEITW